jgi:hypothetical protein
MLPQIDGSGEAIDAISSNLWVGEEWARLPAPNARLGDGGGIGHRTGIRRGALYTWRRGNHQRLDKGDILIADPGPVGCSRSSAGQFCVGVSEPVR